jgi:hypothetical protein
MPKPNYIELTGGKLIERLPIFYEDRSVIAIDQPEEGRVKRNGAA